MSNLKKMDWDESVNLLGRKGSDLAHLTEWAKNVSIAVNELIELKEKLEKDDKTTKAHREDAREKDQRNLDYIKQVDERLEKVESLPEDWEHWLDNFRGAKEKVGNTQ